MKNLIIKLDRAVLNVLTGYIQRWIEKREYKKHKIDFKIRYEYVQLAALIVWGIAIPAALYVVQGDPFTGGIHAAVWLAIGCFEYLGIQHTIHREKALHDRLFALRENPEYNKMHKQILEELFVEGRRARLISTAFIIGITVTLFAVSHFALQSSPDDLVWQYLFANAIANTLKRYIVYVNDFDEPKKKKKASEAITELMSRLWGEFIGGFAPMPAPAYQRA